MIFKSIANKSYLVQLLQVNLEEVKIRKIHSGVKPIFKETKWREDIFIYTGVKNNMLTAGIP